MDQINFSTASLYDKGDSLQQQTSDILQAIVETERDINELQQITTSVKVNLQILKDCLDRLELYRKEIQSCNYYQLKFISDK
jgi:hypothetical protein